MSPTKIRAHVDTALNLLRRHSMESANADWPALRAEAHLATADARSPEDTYDAIRQVIATLGNPHTKLITSHRWRRPPAPTGWSSDPTGRSVEPTDQLVGVTGQLVLPETDPCNSAAYVRTGLTVPRSWRTAPAGRTATPRSPRTRSSATATRSQRRSSG